MAVQAGQAWIQVNPSLRGFHQKIRQDLAKELGRDLKIPVTPDADWSKTKRDAVKQGADAGGGFARAFRSRVDAALKSIPDVRIGADTSEADTEIAGLRTRLQALRDLRIGVDIDAGEALAEIQAVQTRLQQISGDDARIDVRADTAAAAAQLAAIDAQVSHLDGREANIEVNVDRDGRGRAGLTDMSRGMFYASNQVSNLAIAGGLIAPALVPGLGAAAAAAFALGSALASAGVGVGGLVAAVIPAFQNITQATQAQEAADKSAATTAVQAGQQRVNAAYQAEQAARRVQDAQEAADRAAVDGARRVEDAREQVARAQERAADMIEAAERRVAAAARQVTDAQRAEQRAQENLTEARRDAIRELERMRELVSDLARDEQGAELALQQAQLDLAEIMGQNGGTAVEAANIALADAQANLNALQASGSASALELAQAQLAVSQAQQQLNDAMHAQAQLALDQEQAQLDLANAQDHLSDIQQEQADAQQALNEAEQQGIDGMPQVVAAQEALANASQDVADALASQQDAQEELADAQVEAARTVADAQQDLVVAQEQSARANADAARAVRDAMEAQAQGAAQSAAAMAAGSAAAQNLAYAMGQLTPMQQELLAGWISLRDAFTAWAESLEPHTLPVFIKAFGLLEKMLPLLSPIVIATAEAFGYLLDLASAALEDPFWQEFFRFLAATAGPNVAAFGEILGNLARGFAGMMMAFQPFVSQVMIGLVNMSEGFADWGETLAENDQFQAFIDYILDIWPQVKSTFGALLAAIGSIVQALAPLAGPVLSALEAVFNFIADLPHSVIVGVGVALLAMAVGLQLAAAAAAIAAAPFAAVIALVAGLAAGLIYAWQTSAAFRAGVTYQFGIVVDRLTTAWNWLRDNVFTPLGTYFRLSWERAVAFKDGVVQAWSDLNAAVLAAKIWLYANVVLPVMNYFSALWGGAVDMKDQIVNAFWSLGSALVTAKDWIKRNVVDPIGGFFVGLGEGIVNFFTVTLPNALRTGINGVIGWLNKHMIGNLNKVLGVFNVEIPTIPTIGGGSSVGKPQTGFGNGDVIALNRGGLVPGSGPDRDSVHTFLTPMEGVINRGRLGEIAHDHGVSRKGAIDGINSGRIDPLARGGAFDFIGDIASGVAGAISGIGSQIGDWMKQGAAYALGKVMTPIISGVRHVIPGPEFVQDYFHGVLSHAKDKIVAWGKGKDKESEGDPGKAPGGLPDMTGGRYTFPLPRGSYRVGSPYGPRGRKFHNGWDFPAATGTPVFAPFAGRLTQKSAGNTSYGTYAEIISGSLRSIQAHLSAHVGGNRSVRPGETVGRVGSTGNSSGPHLHQTFEVNRRHQNPRNFLKFDQGGYLPQGLTLAFNNTGQRERILDPAETRQYESMSGAGEMTNNFYGTPRGLANQVAMDISARRQAFRPMLSH